MQDLKARHSLIRLSIWPFVVDIPFPCNRGTVKCLFEINDFFFFNLWYIIASVPDVYAQCKQTKGQCNLLHDLLKEIYSEIQALGASEGYG